MIGQASLVWDDIKDLGLSAKLLSKWTLKQKESFIRQINKYSYITGKDDVPGADVGYLYSVMERVNRYSLNGNDEEMRRWLDPNYIIVDWTNTNQGLPYPNLAALAPPLPTATPIVATAQANCYIVPHREDGQFILGLLIMRFPGLTGFVLSSPTPSVCVSTMISFINLSSKLSHDIKIL